MTQMSPLQFWRSVRGLTRLELAARACGWLCPVRLMRTWAAIREAERGGSVMSPHFRPVRRITGDDLTLRHAQWAAEQRAKAEAPR